MDHAFRPTRYHRTFGPHEPVLRVRPGDRVATTTVDAFGRDQSSEPATEGGNPLTGPFYVEGAERGDTLVVRVESVEPNRDFGTTVARIAPHVVDPAFVGELPERALVDWHIDRQAGIATLADPDAAPAILEVPLAPMLGCIGVAPDRAQAISTATSGPFGGNMDYRGVVAGVTMHFPVFLDGALLFVGDGHAAQGDGEIVGTGIETSMDVVLSVDLEKGRTISWPRGESDSHVFTLGNARPLDQALQHATTELVRWLRADFGFNVRGASHLLGQAGEYEIGNVFDPAYTVVAKLARRYLP